jgi:hypothetical protein
MGPATTSEGSGSRVWSVWAISNVLGLRRDGIHQTFMADMSIAVEELCTTKLAGARDSSSDGVCVRAAVIILTC